MVKSAVDFPDDFVEKAIALAHKATREFNGIDDLDQTKPESLDNDNNLFRAHRLTHALEHIAVFETSSSDIAARIDLALMGPSRKKAGHTLIYTLDNEEGIEHEHSVGFAFYKGFASSHDCELKGIVRACQRLSGL